MVDEDSQSPPSTSRRKSAAPELQKLIEALDMLPAGALTKDKFLPYNPQKMNRAPNWVNMIMYKTFLTEVIELTGGKNVKHRVMFKAVKEYAMKKKNRCKAYSRVELEAGAYRVRCMLSQLL